MTLTRRTKRLIEHFVRLDGDSSDGIYYVLRLPNGWIFYYSRFDDYPDDVGFEHETFWKDEIVQYLAKKWHKSLNLEYGYLKTQLIKYPHGFPRGRITDKVIFHGDNLKPWMNVTKQKIEDTFGLSKPKWEFTTWEQVNKEDYLGLKNLLHIKEHWDYAKF